MEQRDYTTGMMVHLMETSSTTSSTSEISSLTEIISVTDRDQTSESSTTPISFVSVLFAYVFVIIITKFNKYYK